MLDITLVGEDSLVTFQNVRISMHTMYVTLL